MANSTISVFPFLSTRHDHLPRSAVSFSLLFRPSCDFTSALLLNIATQLILPDADLTDHFESRFRGASISTVRIMVVISYGGRNGGGGI